LFLKIDLHVHSSFSDGGGTPEQILIRAEEKGLDGLAITDHDSLDGYYQAKELDSDLLLIPGYEVDTSSGHVLILGLEELPPFVSCREYVELISWAQGLGGLCVLAHPGTRFFDLKNWRRLPPDAVEVLNASYPVSFFVGRGLRLSKLLGVPGVGGSDSHRRTTVGDAYTVIECEKPSVLDVLNGIRKESIQVKGELSSLSYRVNLVFPQFLGYQVFSRRISE
jgi:predicted metal-dependent phosphoesterase TrpH